MHNRNYRNEGTEATGWYSFISGALIGGGVALLLAPQSGTELRGCYATMPVAERRIY